MHYQGVGLEELLERYFASDDEEAMAELVRETRPKLLAVARRICGAEAEDAVQTAYLSLAKKGGLGGVPVLPWLLTAVARIAYRTKATRAREHAIAERLAPSASPPEPPEIAIGGEEAELLRRELWRLPPDYRDALQLRYLHGLSGAEAARLLGVNESTLRTRLQRGRLLLRSRLARVLHPFLALPWLMSDAGASAALALGGTMKLKLALLALLLAALGAFHMATRGRAPLVRAASAAAASPSSADAVSAAEPASPGADIGTDGHESQPAPVSAEERARYLEWRRVSPLFASTRRLQREIDALVEEVGGRPDESPPVGDAITADYLAGLIRECRSLPAGAERQQLLQRIVEMQREYLAATQDASFLAFLEEVIRTSPIEAERELAVPDADARTLDLLLRLADHPDPGVRAAVVRSLAASDDARGVAAVARGLEDEASGVRWTAAIEIECLADPAHLPALLDRVARETHPLAADSMVRAISALDPEGGVRRVEEAVARAPATVRAVVLAAVAAPVIDVAEDVPVAPAQAAGPDEGTRAYLDRLVAEYRSLPAGQERLAVLEKLAKAHADYLHRSGDASLLAFLAGIARTSPVEDERVAAVRSFSRTDDRRVVDLLMELKQDADAPVRCAVAAALAWTQGQEADRARQALLELLGDPAPSVRRTVAMFVHTPLGDPGNVPRLLSGLRSETDLLAAYAMIDAVLRLDPEAGAARVDAARSEASPSTQAVIDSALRLRAGR